MGPSTTMLAVTFVLKALCALLTVTCLKLLYCDRYEIRPFIQPTQNVQVVDQKSQNSEWPPVSYCCNSGSAHIETSLKNLNNTVKNALSRLKY